MDFDLKKFTLNKFRFYFIFSKSAGNNHLSFAYKSQWAQWDTQGRVELNSIKNHGEKSFSNPLFERDLKRMKRLFCGRSRVARQNLKGGFGIWPSPRQQSSQKVTISSALRNTSFKHYLIR